MTFPAGGFPQGGQQTLPAPHPTMPWGQQPQQQPVPQQQQQVFPGQQGWPQQQQPMQQQQQQVHPTVPFGDPNAPMQQQQQQQPPALHPNTVIQAGPGIPPELVGRTLGQAFGIYSALATDYVTRNPVRGGQPQQQQQQQQPGQQTQQQQQPPRQPGQISDGSKQFFADPDAYMSARDEKLIAKFREELNNNPATQAAQRTQFQTAAEQAARQVPDFFNLRPYMEPILASANPATLTDPQTWIGIADLARGRAMRAGQYQPPQPQTQQPTQQPQQQGWGQPGPMSVPAAAVPAWSFFTEGPTASGNTATGAPAQLTAAQQEAAQKFGMSPEQYAAWNGGVKHGR